MGSNTTRPAHSRRSVLNSVLAAGLVLVTLGGLQAPAPVAAAPFASAAFQRLWQRTDLAVAAHAVARSWLWGDQPGASRQEPYAQAPGGTRLVQYFDKGRMEITDPGADPAGPWFVTNGLLVVELTTGRIQIGAQDYETLAPAAIPVAGDVNDPGQPAPTYAALGQVENVYVGVNGQAPAGTPITALLDREGHWSPTGGRGDLAHVAAYSPDTRHNIADVFWTVMLGQGLIYQDGRYQQGPLMDWIAVLGYPIAEPYWTTVRVGGVDRPVLIQAFQRRVLTYSPGNPPGWQVEMGNVGLHYYNWRYGRPTCPTTPVRGFGTVWAQHPDLANAIGCPQPWRGEQAAQTAVQSFQHGTMLWIANPQDSAFPWTVPSIFVFFADGTYQRFDDIYVDGQSAACSPAPPVGFVVPQRGFNEVWCEGTGAQVRERLGWAVAPEQGGAGAWQLFQHGMMFWTGATNQIFAVFNIYPYDPAPRRFAAFADTFKQP